MLEIYLISPVATKKKHEDKLAVNKHKHLPFLTLVMSRHIHRRLGSNSILASPQCRDRLQLRVKVQPGLSVEVVSTITRNRVLVSGEGEHWKRDGDRDLGGSRNR